MNTCIGPLYCSYFFYSSFHSLYEVHKQCSIHAYHIQATPPALTSFARCSYFTYCFMNLKHYLCRCLSRIILYYCSKLNTILTSKVLYTKVFSTFTHLYESDLLEYMHPLFFSLQPQVYMLFYTELLFFTYDKTCQLNKPCYLCFQILSLILLVDYLYNSFE